MMSKQHYEAIADELAWHRFQEANGASEQALVDSIAEGLATKFAGDNPRFSRDRFIEAVMDPSRATTGGAR